MTSIDSSFSGSRVSRAEALARHLEREISTQALPPGERLGTKTELRQRFGVAIATVNEAVRLMESRGLVAARPGPGGGVFVAKRAHRGRANTMLLGFDWDHATLGDCVELRQALEPLICRHAARWSTAEVIERLEDCVARMEASLDDQLVFLTANWEFHRYVAANCRNRPLASVYLVLVDILEAGLHDFPFGSHDQESVLSHRELAAAIAEGPGPRLEAAIWRHARQTPLSPWPDVES